LAGEGQSLEIHALCHWINQKLGAPIFYSEPIDPVEADHGASLAALAADLHARKIDAVIIADSNPVYDAPDELDMTKAIASAPFSAHLGRYHDETAGATIWHLPLSHELESWGDARAPDGTACLIQPLIKTLYDSRTRDEFLALLANEPVTKAYDLTRATWKAKVGTDFESWWRTALTDGMIPGSAAAAITPPPPRLPALPRPAAPPGLTVVLGPHPSLWDGRFANNAWLQECPAPFTKEVWGNAVQLAPEDAARLGVQDGDTVDVTVAGQTISAPAAIMTAQAEGVIAASWGQGRKQAGRIGTAVGARFLGLGDQPSARLLGGAQLRKSAATVTYRSTQDHTRLSGRAEELFQIATLADLEHPKADAVPASFLPPPPRDDYAWAMVIDTNACIGCNACVVACQAENNVPVVGPEEISQGRDMHWLRVDAYARPEGDQARQGFQPVPCMHCELAPCEPVCPVEASVHDHEGINVQVYNRCIGTRFCEANCPYKVRRFNWFDYSGEQAYQNEGAALRAQHNPDVSARGRGVMEKCNYCLQRVSRARRAAEKAGRSIAEGEMVTACQAACPTRAIHFGDLNNPASEVTRLRQAPRHYTLLAELNTRPRTTYLKRIYDAGDDEK
jgi:molybdopterin-containing oxidoreductase family iron-sulfur binding subunit